MCCLKAWILVVVGVHLVQIGTMLYVPNKPEQQTKQASAHIVYTLGAPFLSWDGLYNVRPHLCIRGPVFGLDATENH